MTNLDFPLKGLVAIPVYNEFASLPAVIASLLQAIPHGNLLFIDDGSVDDSSSVLIKAGVRYLRHPVNLGYVEAVKTALQYTWDHQFEYTVFFDADGQHRVVDLLKVIAAYDSGNYDLIIGSRYKGRDTSAISLRFFGTSMFSRISSFLTGASITDVTCGLKLITRKFIPLVLKIPVEDLHAELIIALSAVGARIHEVEIEVMPREHGVSMYHFGKAFFYPAKTLLCMFASRFHRRHGPWS